MFQPSNQGLFFLASSPYPEAFQGLPKVTFLEQKTFLALFLLRKFQDFQELCASYWNKDQLPFYYTTNSFLDLSLFLYDTINSKKKPGYT